MNARQLDELSAGAGQLPYRYGVYGISLRSEMPLSLPRQDGHGLVEIEVRSVPQDVFSTAIRGKSLQARSDWYHYAHLDDGSSYVRWSGLGEFLVSADGLRIACFREPAAPMESFQVYLLGQALSFALVKSGFEPLHATALDVDGEAVVLLGGSGFGKSSLAACFLAAGDSLLTDDLLLLQPGASRYLAYPGPPRIKLFPGLARRFLGSAAEGEPMNAETEKLILPLNGRQSCQGPVPLRAMYAIAPPSETRRTGRIRIEPLSPRESFLALVGNTFNYMVNDPERLQRQVRQTARLMSVVEVKKLSYPRVLSDLPQVREAILADLNRSLPIVREQPG